ncbi:NRDE family protein [Pararhodospirillum photometricum]|uniref:NRDE family protein n=1 Tax=Pararhodospirillum photometricum DSM 122 TaxID=1150469 RepID=H6SQV3_PARPM|nr:NRDE family protein [Pararhodospirillum photometricum]CCG07418.1 Putative uncharacterized protein [Pararhodospirillum photometricum DSM 122]
MCLVVVDWCPGAPWPLVLAGNRDERRQRPWRGPARHWPEQPEVRAPLDDVALGTWIGVNDDGVMACVVNRQGTLGPEDGRRSRGELVLEALGHADASEAAQALQALDGRAYRPFSLIVADNRDAFWLRHADPSGRAPVQAFPLPPGLCGLTARDLNDTREPRLARVLARLGTTPRPDPDHGLAAWEGWVAALGDRVPATPGQPDTAACFMTDAGFGTLCTTLVALAAPEHPAGPVQGWFAPGPPDTCAFDPIA